MRQGRFIAVVGPSGVGKDSVMSAVARTDNRFQLVRRVITRAPEAGGEEYDPVDLPRFKEMEASGSFALSWHAHGLAYGIPAEVDTVLAQGKDVLANLSRGVLAEANARFSPFVALALSAPKSVLAARLAGRGRETAADIKARLERAENPLPKSLHVVQIANDGSLDQTVDRVLAALQAQSA
jgi:ribose 1,5-bisphosphokinase